MDAPSRPVALVLLACAAGLSMVVALPQPVQATSCEVTSGLDEIDLREVDGILEVDVIAVARIPLIRDTRVWQVPRRVWGDVPQEELGLRQVGGTWGPQLGYGLEWWICTRAPHLGEHRFTTFTNKSAVGFGSWVDVRSAYEPADPSFFAVDGPLAQRFGPPTEFSTSPLTRIRAWTEAWGVTVLVVAVVLAGILRRLRRRPERRSLLEQKVPIWVALGAGVVLLIAPRPENLGGAAEPLGAGFFGFVFFFTLYLAVRLDILPGLLLLAGYLFAVEGMFHVVRDLSNGTIDVVSKAVLLSAAMVAVLGSAVAAAWPRAPEEVAEEPATAEEPTPVR